MKNWAIKILPIVIFFAGAMVLAHYIKQNSPNRDDAKLKELEEIVASVPPFPQLGNGVTPNVSSGADIAGLTFYYHSVAKYEEVRNYYVEQFLQRGWVLAKETPRTLKFSKGEFQIGIEYTGKSGKSRDWNDWNYAISYTWSIRI